MLDKLRNAGRDNLSLIIFLCSYFVLTVAGNLLYLVPGGDSVGEIAIKGFRIENFKTSGTFGYLFLLLIPFVVTPVIALATRGLLKNYIDRVARSFSEFSPIDYAIIILALYTYVAYAFGRADAVSLLSKGDDVYEAVQSRFELLQSLGYWPQMALKSLLIFLACYSFIRALQGKELFWVIAAISNFVIMTVLLVLLNMKWPLLIFYAALAVSTFSFARERPYLGTLAISILILAAYSLISVFLVRLAPPPAPPSNGYSQSTQVETARSPLQFLTGTTSAAIQNSRLLGLTVINRMAQPYPYYYETFTAEGAICGTLLDRIKRKTNPCQPSNLIYQKMFKDAKFADEVFQGGTAPQAIHIYGYALGSWTAAFLELILASIVIGCFIAVPALASGTTATIVVMGGLTGYFFSQLPFEGPIIYDHGVLWWALLIVAYSLYKHFAAKIGLLSLIKPKKTKHA